MNWLLYSAQISILALAGALLAFVFRLVTPRLQLIYWQLVLAACVIAPLLEPRRTAGIGGVLNFSVRAAGVAHHAATLTNLAPIVIAAGVLLRMLRIGGGLWKLRCIRKRAQLLHCAPPCLVELALQLAIRPLVYTTNEVAGPASFGNTILLPNSWLRLEPAVHRAILCHELLHVKRRDWPFHLAEEITRAAFWFHPAVWWLVERIRLVREQVLDLAVLDLAVPRETYIHALLSTAHSGWSPAPCFSNKRQSMLRLENILQEVTHEVTMSKQRAVFVILGIAIGLAAAGHFAVWSFPLQSSDKVYKIGEGITPPRVLQTVDPDYTEAARDAKIEGTVGLAVEINVEGSAQNIRITKSLDAGLDENAIAAVEQWRFQPGMKDGAPVTVAARIEVNFRLK